MSYLQRNVTRIFPTNTLRANKYRAIRSRQFIARIICFFNYLEIQTMVKVQKPSDYLIFHTWLRFAASSKTDWTIVMSSIHNVSGSEKSQIQGVGSTSTSNPEHRKVLCVGLACLDSIHVVKTYPVEDTDVRCVSMRWQRGGNASNNCTVLSQLGASCEFLGTLSKKQHLSFVVNDFKAYNICINNCVYYEACDAPTSVVIISQTTGSRTIIHSNKNLPELSLDDFKKLDLSQYSWIHFEGRNVEEVVSMIQFVEFWNESHTSEHDRGHGLGHKALPISIEIEKPRTEMQDLVPWADVLFVGKEYAEFCGCANMSETLKRIAESAKPNATIISAWGERGAMAHGHDGTIVQSPAFCPHTVLDTLGAGDTFCGAAIFGLSRGTSLQESIVLACQIAGIKVGMDGFAGLDKAYNQIKSGCGEL